MDDLKDYTVTYRIYRDSEYACRSFGSLEDALAFVQSLAQSCCYSVYLSVFNG